MQQVPLLGEPEAARGQSVSVAEQYDVTYHRFLERFLKFSCHEFRLNVLGGCSRGKGTNCDQCREVFGKFITWG